MIRLPALVLCLSVALPAAAQQTTPTEPNAVPDTAIETAPDPRANPIIQQMQIFVDAYNAADATAIAALYTPDAALLPPQSAPLVGPEAIAAHYAAAFENGASNLRAEVQEIRQHGDAAAVEIGETLVDLGDRTIRGRYIHVWQLTPDTGWQLSRDFYHVLAVGTPE